jgi:hypothetical protein
VVLRTLHPGKCLLSLCRGELLVDYVPPYIISNKRWFDVVNNLHSGILLTLLRVLHDNPDNPTNPDNMEARCTLDMDQNAPTSTRAGYYNTG